MLLKKDWLQAFNKLMKLPSEEVDQFDFGMLDFIDGVFDMPIHRYFPYLLKAFPNARVILSNRNASDWMRSRVENHPGSWVHDLSVRQSMKKHLNEIDSVDLLKHQFDAKLSYAMMNTMIRCITPPLQLLEVNVLKEDNEKTVVKLQAFLNFSAEQKRKYIFSRQREAAAAASQPSQHAVPDYMQHQPHHRRHRHQRRAKASASKE